MKRNRKAISFVLVLALVLCSNTTVFASIWGDAFNSSGSESTSLLEGGNTVTANQHTAVDAAANATALNNLGLFSGTSTKKFEPDLDSNLTREQGITLIIRSLGLEQAAREMSDSEADIALAKFTDKDSVSGWAKNYVAYAVKNGFVNGTSVTTLSSKSTLTGEAYATMILRQLGFNPDYNNSIGEYARLGGLSPSEQSALFGSGSLTRGQAAGISLNTLAMTPSGTTTTLIQELVNNHVVAADTAQDSGFGSMITDPSAADNTGDTGAPAHHKHSSGNNNTDTTPPTFTVTAASITGGDTITLDFSEPMNTSETINTLAVFQKQDLTTTGVPLDTSGASIVWTDSDTLKITLSESPTSYIPAEAYVGVVLLAHDTAGLQTTSSAVYTTSPVMGEQEGPNLTSWTLNSGVLTLNFNEIVQCSSIAVDSIKFKNDLASPSAIYMLTSFSQITTSSSYSNIVTISLGDDTANVDNVVTSGPSIYLELPGGIKDLLNNQSLLDSFPGL